MEPAAVHVERTGAGSVAQEILPAAAVAQTIRDLEGQRDVTLTISPVGGSARLLIAVDGSMAFLGLERADEIFQFATHDASAAEPTRPLMIGGQETDIDSRYVLGLQAAATVIQDWLDNKESSIGFWDRR